MMVTYENSCEVGLYREETGIVCAGGQITVSAPVAWNCHASLRNKPSANDIYTLGVEWLYNVTDNTWNAIDISAANGLVLTIGAGHNGDTFNLGYYARGMSPPVMGIVDGDIVRPEHIDAIYRGMDAKGNINPLGSGYVFDQVMAYEGNTAITGLTEFVVRTRLDADEEGTWSFENDYPFYVTNIHVEAKKTALQAGKGLDIRFYSGATLLSYGAGGTGIVLNDQQGWWVTEYNDGVDTWYVADLRVGMTYWLDFRVKVGLYNSNSNISAGDVRAFISGWHMPDPLPEYASLLTDFSATAAPIRIGAYREEVFTASAINAITVSPPIAFRLDGTLRTVPHHLNAYRNGIEFVYNITTSNFVTDSITSMTSTTVSFNGTMVSPSDTMRIGYYAAREEAFDAPLLDAGDTILGAHVDGIEAGMAQLDRIDFGKSTFPYGVGEYEWHYSLWKDFVLVSGSETYPEASEIGAGWTTVLAFDPVSYTSRRLWDDGTYKNPDTLRNTYGIDETPFFLTGIVVKVDKDAVSGGIRRNDRIALRISLNGTQLRQGGSTTLYYYPMANTASFGNYPAPLRLDEDYTIADSDCHMFYVPLGIVRCQSIRIDMKVEAATAFTTIRARCTAIEGFIIDEV